MKRRLPTTNLSTDLTENENQFLTLHTGNDRQLSGYWSNEFNRITLVSRTMDERCTVDFNIRFQSAHKNISFDDLVIVEIKQGRSDQKSKLSQVLKESKSYPLGFSKYCIGRALPDRDLKSNLFKAKLLKLYKYLNTAA